MSDNPFAIADPFDSSVPDEETELRTLARALQFADGFSLLFVRCHQHDQRQHLVAALRRELPHFNVLELHFKTPVDHLLHELRLRITQPPPDAVFVYGLEYSLPTAAEAHATPFVANLNAARNSFGLIVPCPLVLWVPEYVLTAIMRGAPDFFSVRSGVYYFAPMPQETAAFAESLTAGEGWMMASLPFEEKQERIAAIENLLADYRALPPAQRDRYAEARLLKRLGTLYDVLRQWTEAEKRYQQSLAMYREIGDRVGEGLVLKNLGTVCHRQGRWAEAEASYHQSLTMYREIGDRVNEGRVLINLGGVYFSQGRWAEAETSYQQSLKLFREVGDRVGEGNLLHNLGRVYFSQGRRAEAEAFCQQSLEMYRETGDRVGEGNLLHNLGGVYFSQGRWAEAEASYHQSLKLFRKIGDRVGEGRILENLAVLQGAQGNIAGALKLGRQAVEVLETTEDKAELEKARQLVAEWSERLKYDA